MAPTFVYKRSTMQPEWNALYVRHNHEKAASRFLAAHGVDHYLPLYSEQSEWSNRQKSRCRAASLSLATYLFASRQSSGGKF